MMELVAASLTDTSWENDCLTSIPEDRDLAALSRDELLYKLYRW